MRQPHLKHVQIIRLGRLLDMLYRPAEIAEEIGVTSDTVYRSYLPAGCPYTRDRSGDFWIHGPAFVAWARATITQKRTRRQGLPDGMAWCLKCNQPVELVEPSVRPLNRYLELLTGRCPHCGTAINRGRKAGGAA
jgi:hypothetical protein